MMISWEEPMSDYRARLKEQFFGKSASNALLRVGFWLFIILPFALFIIQTFIPNKGFKWYYLPIILSIVILFVSLQIGIMYFVNRPNIIVDDDGIKLRGGDGWLFCNHYYRNIKSIELFRFLDGSMYLSWTHKNKSYYRGVAKGTDIEKLRSVVGWSSNLTLIENSPNNSPS